MQPRSCPLFLQQLIRDGEGAVQGVGEGSKAKGLLVSGTHVLSAVLAPADGVLHLLLALDLIPLSQKLLNPRYSKLCRRKFRVDTFPLSVKRSDKGLFK
ncbi:hypothetical protein TNIN_290441 [Trichonephila inaurata madagascariensis]|uniref:Uncharacterized protein n=1 Tax=Trichonephila inaurata madagascariensis TaxID=2747483 RepID=A0A8X7BS89_9ARAC|nr:hypothetical protein TNIN_290441 [Trichonephila inaurata madagascariensis]